MVRETATTRQDPRTEAELAMLRAVRDSTDDTWHTAVTGYLNIATEVDQMQRANRMRVALLSGTPGDMRREAGMLMLELDPNAEV